MVKYVRLGIFAAAISATLVSCASSGPAGSHGASSNLPAVSSTSSSPAPPVSSSTPDASELPSSSTSSSPAGTSSGPGASHGVPGLGYAGFVSNGAGWGTPSPSLLDNGGDPGGKIDHVSWTSWGGGVAYGQGLQRRLKEKGGWTEREYPIQLRASDLGSCFGKFAYRKLSVRPGSSEAGDWGDWVDPNGNVCQKLN